MPYGLIIIKFEVNYNIIFQIICILPSWGDAHVYLLKILTHERHSPFVIPAKAGIQLKQ